MAKDYSSYGPAYRNLTVRDDVFVPEPMADFSGDNPFTRMAAIRGEIKDLKFDENYTYLDHSLKFRIGHVLCYVALWTAAFFLNWLRYGLKVEGREKIRRNRKLFKNGVMTVCNHVYRWDMMCVFRAMGHRMAWIPMYSEPFKGSDNWVMRHIGGVAIPEERGGLRKFNEAMDELHSKKQWIHIFPESCSWKFYSPIRPFKIGAFNMAYRYGLPVVPMVISFRPRTGWRKYFCKDEPLVSISVGDPIIPDLSLPRKAETARIRDLAHSTMLNMAGIITNPWPSCID